VQYAELGRRIVERLCQRAKRGLFRRPADRRPAASCPPFDRRRLRRGRPRRDEGIRRGARHVPPDYKEERAAAIGPRKPEPGWFGLGSKAVKFKLPQGEDKGTAIPIRGINSDLPVRFAPEGGAVPGDRIVGIMTPGEGITIYPIQSSALKDFEETPERWLDVRWDVDGATPQRFPRPPSPCSP